MQDLIAQLQDRAALSPAQVEQAVAALVSAEVADETKAAFLRALRAKGESAEEIAAFAQALLARAVDPGLDPARLPGPMLDVCGTGGDRLELFNISTASMFVLAAGGAAVVKHGNRAITSKCGGADVLETLGVPLDLPPARLKACVEQHGLGFVFAPAYHPAFKTIAPVRKALAGEGTATVFNILGPLLNPARPAFQLTGIFDRTLLRKYAAVFALLGRKRAWAIHGDGADEIALWGHTDVCETRAGEEVREFQIDPDGLACDRCELRELRGGGREENAAMLLAVLDGTERGPRRSVVALNAAAGFVITGLAADLPAGLALAGEQLDSGRALAKLRALQGFSTE